MIFSHALHACAYVGVRVAGPRETLGALRRVGRLFPLRATDAKEHLHRLRGGTCLTRAITIASRVSGAKVAIGVAHGANFRAHAWIADDRIGLDDAAVHDILTEL